MKTQEKLFWLAMALALVLIIAHASYQSYQKSRQIQEIDGMVYSFIVGKVEGNDDLLAQVLTDKAEGIIKPGRHAFPGAAEEMGERYEIVRYDSRYEEGGLFYFIRFYRPYTERIDQYNVLVINTDEGWLIAENSSIDDYIMLDIMQNEEGKTIHEYKGLAE